MKKTKSGSIAFLCAAMMLNPLSSLATTLTVINATGKTLLARYKDRDKPWQQMSIAPSGQRDFSKAAGYFSVTLYDPQNLAYAITTEQYTPSLGFRPERTTPESYCNDHRCVFSISSQNHGVLRIEDQHDATGQGKFSQN